MLNTHQTESSMEAALPPASGWYPDPNGGRSRRYWDGNAWGPSEPQGPYPHGYPQQGGYYPPQQHPGHFPPQYVAPLVQPHVMQARDRAQYVRQQRGHSIIKHVLFGWMLMWIPAIYYTLSPNHYWHM